MATYHNTIRYGLSLDTTVLPDCEFDQCWLADNSGGPSYIDETADANSTTTADVALSGYGDTDDCIYVGDAATFNSLNIVLSTAAVGGTRVWEYWDGDSWATCETQTVLAGNINLTASSVKVFWFPSADWATTSVNSVTKYYVRLRVTGAYSTAGTISYIAVGRYHAEWSKTVYIPETTTRTFKAAFIQARTHMCFAQYPNACLFVQVGSGTRTATVLSAAISSNSQFFIDHCGDFTSTFTSDFGAGTSQTVKVMFSTLCNQAATRYSLGANASGEIVITYEAEEQQTRIKTVCIPIESHVSNTTTSLVEIGTNQWPALDTFCPEASKTFRDVSLTFRHGYTSVASAYLSYAIDAEGATDTGTLTASSYGTVPVQYTWVRNDVSTSATHAIKVKHTGTNAYGKNVGGMLWATYEYDHTNSTSILNSVIMSVPQNRNTEAGTSSKLEGRLRFMVNEPATVTLAQSAVLWNIVSNSASPAWSIAAGSQSYRAHLAEGSTYLMSLCQRIDSGGVQGAGITLSRGLNTLYTSTYHGSASGNYSIAAYCIAILNYISGKATGGAQTHNKTIWFKLTTATSETLNYTDYTSIVLQLGSYYYIGSATLYWNQKTLDSGFLRVLRIAGEGNAIDGPQIGSFGQMDYTTAHYDWAAYYDTKHFFKRWPTDPEWGRVDGSASHTYEVVSYSPRFFHAILVTFHGITETVSGTVSGYTGDGSGLTVDLFRVDGDEYVGSATTTTGGAYTFTWYSDNDSLYAVCRQSDTLCGRSTDGNAS
jgi:hypothetical protein